MQKELNPELFGQSMNVQEQATSYQAAQELPSQVEKRLLAFKEQYQALHGHVSKWITYFSENAKFANGRMDKIQQSISKLEAHLLSSQQDVHNKLNHLNAKITERRSVEGKIQNLVERHNGVLRSYEVRMNQLMRLLSEKEALLAQAQSNLNEAKMEITRLKRL
jgi:DNA repair exonuclease SbcCD ATPase subunit